MRQSTLLLFFVATTTLGCNSNKKEQTLQIWEDSLVAREQALAIREQQIQYKEQELQKAQAESVDSTTVNDSTAIVNSGYLGRWNVFMDCTETSCPGSAIGDSKTEQWNITYSNGCIETQAMAGQKLIRVYSGVLLGNVLELMYYNADPATQATRIMVRLIKEPSGALSGRREITRNDCKIVYKVQLEKL